VLTSIFFIHSEAVTSYSLHLRRHHEKLLDSLFVAGTYEKLYSYHHLINGFAVHMSSLQVCLAYHIRQAHIFFFPVLHFCGA
jgi:hypothetical protein